jgi:hypothetical protein
VQLDGSSLLDLQATSPPGPEPSPSSLPNSEQLTQINQSLVGLREVVLFSGGLLICCVAATFARLRK